MKLTVKNLQNVFNEFIAKKFENILLLNSLKKFRKFLTVNFIEKKIRHFWENSKKKFVPQKKGGEIGTGIININLPELNKPEYSPLICRFFLGGSSGRSEG